MNSKILSTPLKTLYAAMTKSSCRIPRRHFTKVKSSLSKSGRPFRQLSPDELAPKTKYAIAGRKFLPGSQGKGFPEFLARPTEDFPHAMQVDIDDKLLLSQWAQVCRNVLDEKLNKRGVVLFRGLPISSVQDFGGFTSNLGYSPMRYIGGTGFRKALDATQLIYPASNEPSGYSIEPHNELCYSNIYPSKLIFCCIQAPKEGAGGLTPICKGSDFVAKLDRDVYDKLNEKGVQYTHVLPDENISPSYTTWQQTFLTKNKEDVDRYIEAQGWDHWWDDANRVTYRYSLPAFIDHPETGEKCWFNQIHNNNRSSYEESPMYPPEDRLHLSFDKGSAYGDGSDVEPEVVQHIRSCLWHSTVAFEWQEGDVLVLDNYSALHSRLSFTGPRQILSNMIAV